MLVLPIHAASPAPPGHAPAFNGSFVAAAPPPASALLIPADDAGADTMPAVPAGQGGWVVDVPLPLPEELVLLADGALGGKGRAKPVEVRGILRRSTAEAVRVAVRPAVLRALRALGLAGGVGALRLVQLPSAGPPRAPLPAPPDEAEGGEGGGGAVRQHLLPGEWLPLSLHQGVPLYCLPLCKAVCAQAQAAGFLSAAGQSRQVEAQQTLQRRLDELVERFAWPLLGLRGRQQQSQQQQQQQQQAAGAAWPAGAGEGGAGADGKAAGGAALSWGVVDLPAVNLLFDGAALVPVDLGECVQGGLPL